jgi:hypothetical protein
MFQIHLVPLVLEELFVCRKYNKIWPKWWQIWSVQASGRDRPAWAHRQVPPGPTRAPLDPYLCHLNSLPCQQSMGSPPQPIKNKYMDHLINGQYLEHMDPWVHLSSTHSSLHHRLPAWNLTHDGYVTDFGSQWTPLDAKVVERRASRCPCPPVGTPCLLLHTSTPSHSTL